MILSRRSVLWLGLLAVFAFSGCGDAPQGGAPQNSGAGGGAKPAGPGQPETAKGGATAAPGAGVRRFILLTNGNSPFWDAGRAGLEDAKKELKLAEAGFDAVMEYNDSTIAGQIEKLRQFNSQTDIAGVAISAVNADNVNVAEELRALKKKGVAVVTCDSDMDREKFRDTRTAFIGTDNFQGGVEVGNCLKQLLTDGGEFVSFVGVGDAQNAKERIAGVAKGAGEKIKSVDSMVDDFDPTKARENVRNAISNHPNLKALVGVYSYNAPAIVDVVKELDKRKELKVVAFDAEEITIAEMAKGQVDAMIVQNPYQMGFQSVRLLKALTENDEATQKEMLPKLGEPEGDIYDTGLKLVVPSADGPIKKEGFGAKTEFLILDDFKVWMAKYKLTSS